MVGRVGVGGGGVCVCGEKGGRVGRQFSAKDTTSDNKKINKNVPAVRTLCIQALLFSKRSGKMKLNEARRQRN